MSIRLVFLYLITAIQQLNKIFWRKIFRGKIFLRFIDTDRKEVRDVRFFSGMICETKGLID